jgi:hypothetical protein
MIALIPACLVSNIITQFSILWVVFGAALDPKALRIFVAKLQLARSSRAVTVQQAAAPQHSIRRCDIYESAP